MHYASEPCSKRFKSSVITYICIFCGADCATVKQKTIHILYRICEKAMTQKLLNAAKLLKDHMYNITVVMCGVGNVFAVDIQYHDHSCKGYFNKYHTKIEEIMKNLEMEDSETAGDDSLNARFLALGLDFIKSAHSLTSIREQ